MKHLVYLFVAITWMCGIVLAKGFWSTFFAIVLVPFWSWYLVIEKILQMLLVID